MHDQPSSRMRIAAVALGVVAVLGFIVFLATQAVRGKLAQQGFYEATLREQHVYDRLYDEVLADPAFAPQIDQLLGGVNVKREDLVPTIKQVAKPAYLQALVESLIRGMIGYFRGDPLTFTLDITPIVEGIHGVAVQYAIAEIEQTPVQPSPSLEAFAAEFQTLVTALADRGELPAVIPSYPLAAEADRQLVAGILLAAGQLDPDNAEHAPTVELLFDAIRRDDVALAIKVSAAAMLTQNITRAIVGLTENPYVTQTDGRFVLSPPPSITGKLAAKLSVAQTAGQAATWARIGGIALVLLGCLGIAAIYRGDPSRALRRVAVPLVVAGAIGLVLAGVIRGLVTGKVDAGIQGVSALPPSLRGILSDVSGSVIRDLTPSFWIPSLVVLALGAAAMAGSVGLARRARC